jgi:hypothetical protein
MAIRHYWEVESSERRRFKGAYTRGFNYSNNPDIDDRSLDANPFGPGDFRYDAWEDGYLDAAAGREEGHLLTEHDHENCG